MWKLICLDRLTSTMRLICLFPCVLIGELAYCGHTVHVYDKSPDVLDSVPDQIRLAKKELRAEGLMPHIDFIVSFSSLIYL